MSIPTGPELEQSGSTDGPPPGPDVPLADLPLVADQQKTVVNTGGTPTADETVTKTVSDVEVIHPADALFRADGTDSIPGEVRLGHFMVRRRIGSGGMGQVFLAEDTTLRRQVALKVLRPGTSRDPGLLARFQNEARAAAQLRHDNIAQVYFSGESEGVHYIACEFVDGRTIRQLIEQQQTVEPALVINYAIQAALALNHMDSAGVVHRDIKPSNVLVTHDGRVKIVDLGLARLDTGDREQEDDITVAGATLGTFDYMAPEQARDPREADIRSDVYSLGCTMYHMLTGQPPYPEGTPVQKMLDHQGKQAPDPAEINNRVPEEIARVVLSTMKTDPAERYQTPAELLNDLIQVATDIGLQGVPADGIAWQQAATPNVSRPLSGSVVLFAAVIVICLTAFVLDLLDQNRITPAADPGRQITTAQPSPETPDDAEDPPEQPTQPPGTAGPDSVTGNPTNAAQIPAASGAVIVEHADGTSESHTSLGQALASVLPGDRFLLDYDGIMPVSRSLLDHKRILLQAAAGRQPVLEFRGNAEASDTTAVFRLKNSTLTIRNVGLRLAPTGPDGSRPWALFRCSGTTRVILQQCAVDLQVSGGQPANMIEIEESTSDTVLHTVDLQLLETAVRGDGHVFHIGARINGAVQLKQCGIAVTGSLIQNQGSTSMGPAGELAVDLTHVTTLTQGPLIRIDEDSAAVLDRQVPQLTVTSQACVFCSLQDDNTLVESVGTDRRENLRDLLDWNDQTTLYHDAFEQKMWTLAGAEPGAELPEVINFDAWNDRWSPSDSARAQPFDPQWSADTQPGHPRDMERSWLQINRERFYSRELLLHNGQDEPGVDPRQLPDFADDTTGPRPPERQTAVPEDT